MSSWLLGLAIIALLVLLALTRAQVVYRHAAESARRQTEEALRRHEQRLSLALEVTEDGLWDWNMQTGEVYFSPRLQVLLGFAPDELKPRLETWRTLIHPSDRESLVHALKEHLAGRIPHIIAECRLQTKDNRWVWHLIRCKVVKRDSTGNPLRAIGTHTDISERKYAEEILRNIVDGTAPVTGADFFRRLVKHLANALGMRYVLVGELPTPHRVRSLALWANDGFAENIEYDLQGTPCADVIGRHTCIYPAHVLQQFPHAEPLLKLNAESYVGVPLYDAEGEPLGLLAAIDDKPLERPQLTETIFSIFAARAGAELERLRNGQLLFQAKELAEVTLQSLGDAVITTDAQGRVDHLNPAAESLTGWTQTQARGRPIDVVYHIIDEQTRERLPSPAVGGLQADRRNGLGGHTVLVSQSGQEYAIQDTMAPIRSREGAILGMVLTFSDVSETRRMARQMAHQATHDALTGLVNRNEFERRLERAVAGTKANGTPHALCYMDLDHFKIVNDSAGHVAGDDLLKQVANLLQGRVRGRDTLARMGGDEFSLLLENCPLEKAMEIAEMLVTVIRDFRFCWRGQTFEIGVSIGLVPITAAVENTTQLLTQADVACYTAKDLGRNRVHVYRLEDSVLSQRHSEIIHAAALSTALEEEHFRLYGQPIIPLAEDVGLPPRYELLLRLVDNEGRIMTADTFIAAAERYGMMVSIDRWVIRTALRRYHEFFAPMGAEIEINLSGKSLGDDLLAFVRQQLTQFNVPPQRICFGLTETSAIGSPSQAVHFITELKKSGCRFALDAFGSGLSSFAYLKNLPVDYLKIAGGFVQDMLDDPIDYAMVAAINQVGKTMGIRTIAERVENDALVEHLRELGVDYVQGYASGRPKPLEEIGIASVPAVGVHVTG